MKVTRIHIRNILGQEDLEFSPRSSGITVIRGANKTGKTSVLEAIKAVRKGGHDATLLRHGATTGEVVLVLDNGIELTKKIGTTASALLARSDMGRIGSVKTWLDGVLDGQTFDLVGFLRAEPRERVQMLMRALPAKLPEEKVKALREVLETKDAEAKPLPPDAHPLEWLAQVEREIYDRRTGVNRAFKEKKATVNQLRESLGSGRTPEVLGAEVQRVESGLAKSREQADAALRALALESESKVGEIAREHDLKISELDQERAERAGDCARAYDTSLAAIDAQIKQLQDRRAAEVQEKNKALAGLEAEITARRADHVAARSKHNEAVLGEYRGKMAGVSESAAREQAELREELGRLVKEREVSIKAETTRALAAKLEGEAKDLELHSLALTHGISMIGTLREDLAKHLPVPGLAIRDGEIFVGEVPYLRLSGAEKIGLAFEIARRCVGDLKFLICDGVEALDTESFRALEKLAEESGVQCIVTRVSEGPFEVA